MMNRRQMLGAGLTMGAGAVRPGSLNRAIDPVSKLSQVVFGGGTGKVFATRETVIKSDLLGDVQRHLHELGRTLTAL